MAKEKLWTGPFLSMGSTNFFQLMTQYILVTTLPLCIIDSFQGSEIEAGLAMTFFQIGTSLFRPAAGYFVDKENKRHLLLFSLIVFLIIIGAFNGIENVAEIYGLRLLHGIIFALATTTAASIAVLVIPASRRGEGIGYFSVTTNLAMVIGPLAGLLLYNGADMVPYRRKKVAACIPARRTGLLRLRRYPHFYSLIRRIPTSVGQHRTFLRNLRTGHRPQPSCRRQCL